MSNITDISDFTPGSSALVLPIRSEKIIYADPASADMANMRVTASRKPSFKDYVMIRVAGRDPKNPGVFSVTNSACYWFLINPSEVTVSRQTVDEQAFTRSGWQIGLSGEDFISITMNGKSAGKYFKYGTTDVYTQQTLSYRNLLALEVLFENNGYWFEGEQVQSSLNALQSTKRIKMHSDVELTVGEFVWHGMFETFEVTEDADTPFIADFNLVFIAWKETFRKSTPYPQSLGGEVQRGHVPMATKLQQALSTASNTPIDTSNATVTSLIMSPDGGF